MGKTFPNLPGPSMTYNDLSWPSTYNNLWPYYLLRPLWPSMVECLLSNIRTEHKLTEFQGLTLSTSILVYSPINSRFRTRNTGTRNIQYMSSYPWEGKVPQSVRMLNMDNWNGSRVLMTWRLTRGRLWPSSALWRARSLSVCVLIFISLQVILCVGLCCRCGLVQRLGAHYH